MSNQIITTYKELNERLEAVKRMTELARAEAELIHAQKFLATLCEHSQVVIPVVGDVK